jgi:hypothetical protein
LRRCLTNRVRKALTNQSSRYIEHVLLHLPASISIAEKKTGFDFCSEKRNWGVCAEKEESQDKTVLSIHTCSGFSSRAEYYTFQRALSAINPVQGPSCNRYLVAHPHSFVAQKAKSQGLHLPFLSDFQPPRGWSVCHVSIYLLHQPVSSSILPVSNSQPRPLIDQNSVKKCPYLVQVSCRSATVGENENLRIVALLSILLRFFGIFVELTCISRTPFHWRHIWRINVLLG